MKRYHKNICFPSQYTSQLMDLTNKFNSQKYFKYTTHANDNFKNRFDYMNILQFLKDSIYFKYEDVFEYYIDNDKIVKACFKIHYNEFKDLIIVLSDSKAIVTLYLNNKGDNHSTLKHELYSTN